MRLRRLLRTYSVRIALFYGASLGVAVLAAFGVVYWISEQTMAAASSARKMNTPARFMRHAVSKVVLKDAIESQARRGCIKKNLRTMQMCRESQRISNGENG